MHQHRVLADRLARGQVQLRALRVRVAASLTTGSCGRQYALGAWFTPTPYAVTTSYTSAADVRSATSASTAPATAAASGLSDSCTKRDEVTRVPEYSKIPWSIATRIDSS